MEGHQAVDVPDHQYTMAEIMPVKQIGDAAHYLGSVPVLTHNYHNFALADRWLNNFSIDMWGHALVIIIDFGIFSIVDTAQIIFTDPLRPTLENQLAAHTFLSGRFGRITYKDQVGSIAQFGQSFGEFSDARSEAASG